MSEETEASVEERLAIFDDEADFDDWAEIFIGGFIALFGLWQLANVTGSSGDTFIEASVMQWIASGVTIMGLLLAAHGLKDMAVKEVRESIVRLEASNRQGSIDYGLIRDVLLHQDQYRKFLLEAYEEAYSDGVLTDDELSELKSLQEALQLSDEDAAKIATRGAINAAIKDGTVNQAELVLILDAAGKAGLSDEDKESIQKALDDGKIDDTEMELLDSILGSID